MYNVCIDKFSTSLIERHPGESRGPGYKELVSGFHRDEAWIPAFAGMTAKDSFKKQKNVHGNIEWFL
jgi:hypothetical protein